MNTRKTNTGSDLRYKIKVGQPKFYIHSHKKIVVCELKCEITDLPFKGKISRKYFNDAPWYGEFTVKASAKCRPGDEYNEETGLKIAESKAMLKVYDRAKRILEDYKDIVGKEWDKANDSIDFFDMVLSRELQHLENLVK